MTPEDLFRQRDDMVHRQLWRRGVSDGRVLDAMRAVPREAFVPDQHRPSAYDDQPLPIGGGQTISQPYVIAAVCQALALRGAEHVLEIGTGSGYSSAVLGRLAHDVVTVERDPGLAGRAREALERLGVANVTMFEGDGSRGYPDYAPYDAIAVHALARELPQALLEQLAPGGRLVVPLPAGAEDRLTLITENAGSFERETLDAVRFVPLVPDTP